MGIKDEEKKDVKNSPDGSLEEIKAWLAKNASEKNPRVITRLQFQGENDLQPEQKFSHLFVVSVQGGGDATQLTSGFQSFNQASWSPDGSQFVFSSDFEEKPEKHNLYTRSVDGDSLHQLTDGDWKDSYAWWTRDGKYIYFNSDRSGKTQVFRISMDGMNCEKKV